MGGLERSLQAFECTVLSVADAWGEPVMAGHDVDTVNKSSAAPLGVTPCSGANRNHGLTLWRHCMLRA